jgi:site-specific recombinase XerD
MNLLLSRFKEYLFSQSPTPSKVTVKNYLSDISNFLRWLQNKTGAEFNPATLTFEFIQAYKNENSELLSSSSMERHLSSLRKFFKFLKDEDIVKINIFEQAQVEKTAQIQDPFKLKDFKNFLFKSNSSHLTIKNYIIDIKQFLIWAKQVLEIASDEDVLNNISSRLIEEYKTRLNSDGGVSPATVNRKLSSGI